MRLSDFENEDALDLIADLIEPAAEIFTDNAVVEPVKKGNKVKAVKAALKMHKKAVIEILAALDQVPVEKYNKNVVGMTIDLLELLNDKQLMTVFYSQGQMEVESLSGSATENTEAEQ